MAKIIFSSRYIKNPGKANAGKLLRYAATREGVEKVAVGLDRSPSTVRQQRLIKNILEAFPETKDYLEYEDYLKEPCKSNATEFIDAAIERNIDRLDGVKNLVKYYAERPGVEKFGAHGLFSQTMIRSISMLLLRKSPTIKELYGRTSSVSDARMPSACAIIMRRSGGI